MFWPIATVVTFVALLAVHFWWRRRFLHSEQQARVDAQILRKQLKEESLEFQTQQLALFDSMVEGLLLLDENDRVQLANRMFIDLFEVTVDVRGKTILEVLRQHELTGLLERVKREK